MIFIKLIVKKILHKIKKIASCYVCIDYAKISYLLSSFYAQIRLKIIRSYEYA